MSDFHLLGQLEINCFFLLPSIFLLIMEHWCHVKTDSWGSSLLLLQWFTKLTLQFRSGTRISPYMLLWHRGTRHCWNGRQYFILGKAEEVNERSVCNNYDGLMEIKLFSCISNFPLIPRNSSFQCWHMQMQFMKVKLL